MILGIMIGFFAGSVFGVFMMAAAHLSEDKRAERQRVTIINGSFYRIIPLNDWIEGDRYDM